MLIISRMKQVAAFMSKSLIQLFAQKRFTFKITSI